MNRAAVYHEAKSRWAYAADSDTLHIRLRTGHGEAESVMLTAVDPFRWYMNGVGEYIFDTESIFRLPMAKEYSDGLFDYWFCQIRDNPTKRLRYSFIIDEGGSRIRYGMRGFTNVTDEKDISSILDWFNFPFLNEEDIYTAPAWVAQTVWYQIFCDRFARSGGDETIVWGKETGGGLHRTFYGGNLRGVIEKLPYIAGMGFNGIYFTPIFVSPSTHKYDTADYFNIDPQFGTNEDFRELVDKAHELGIRIMLDAVFNHCGFKHPFFQDVIKNGRNSPYFNYFHILREPVADYLNIDDVTKTPQMREGQNIELPYHAFAFVTNMPKWNTANPGAREYLYSVARFWVEEFGIDGWRFDVSNEVSHDFWRGLRKQLKAMNPDLLLLGENWDDAYPWLCGEQFDSVMNYEMPGAVNGFLSGYLDAAGFAAALTRGVLAAYPKPVQGVLFNLLDCHDTDRLLTICNGNAKAAALGYVLLMTLGGSPCVYYGGEVGMEGGKHGGENRRCMPWDKPIPPERDYRDLLTKLIALRRRHPSFRTCDVEFICCESSFTAYRKKAGDEVLTVLVNNSNEEHIYSLPGGKYIDAMSGTVWASMQGTLPAYGYALLLGD